MQLNSAETYLTDNDPILSEVIKLNGHLPMRPKRNNYEALVRSIIGQQISVKAAAKIFERFAQSTDLDPHRTLELTEDQIKLIGLSGQKTRYLSDLAQHFVSDPQVFDHLDSLDDEQVIVELTRVKGIGIWTAQMFLMFTLGRPDVFAPGDRGLQLAIDKLYDLSPKPTEKELALFARRWQPYRTTASLHLWQSLNNEPKA